MRRMTFMLIAMTALAGSVLADDAERERERARAEREEVRAQREALRQELEAAREQMREAAKRVAELSREMGGRSGEAFVYEFIGDENRGMIGVVLDRDGENLRIASVTPGSPAEEAGVEAGDVIVAVNGEPITFDDEEEAILVSLPEPLREIEVGDEITLTLKGENGTRDVVVEAGRREPLQWHHAMRELRLHAPPAPGMPMDFAFPAPHEFKVEVPRIAALVHPHGNRWGRIELAGLNEDLGEYFGTDQGVLVVSAPQDNPLGLKGGDVILSIGDREPKSPSHAFRIVHSYGEGETLEVEIIRHGKRQTLSHELSEEDFSGLGFVPPRLWDSAFPAPVAPHAPGALPAEPPAPAAPPAVVEVAAPQTSS